MNYLQFIPIGKKLLDGLNMVMNLKTDKSVVGCITRSEIISILMSCVEIVCAMLGTQVINDEPE